MSERRTWRSVMQRCHPGHATAPDARTTLSGWREPQMRMIFKRFLSMLTLVARVTVLSLWAQCVRTLGQTFLLRVAPLHVRTFWATQLITTNHCSNVAVAEAIGQALAAVGRTLCGQVGGHGWNHGCRTCQRTTVGRVSSQRCCTGGPTGTLGGAPKRTWNVISWRRRRCREGQTEVTVCWILHMPPLH